MRSIIIRPVRASRFPFRAHSLERHGFEGRAGQRRIGFSSTVAAVVVAVLIAARAVGVFQCTGDTGAAWAHLADTVLGEFVFQHRGAVHWRGRLGCPRSVDLGLADHDAGLPRRRFLEWALVLPLAMRPT